MYKIMSNGICVAIVDEVTYCRMQDNGCYGLTDRDHAQGISICGDVYQIPGRTPLVGVTKTADVLRVESGEVMMETNTAVDHLAANQDYISMMSGIDLPTEEPVEVKPDEAQ